MSVVQLSGLGNFRPIVAGETTTKRFGHAVRRRRLAAGLSQEALATVAKLHPTYISLIERGLRDPKLTSICKIAGGLKINAGILVDEALRGRTRG